MGANSSRASVRQANSSAANYANGGDGANGATQLPRMNEPLYTGPIHTLCRVGDDSLLSGGVDKVQKIFNVYARNLHDYNIVYVCTRYLRLWFYINMPCN